MEIDANPLRVLLIEDNSADEHLLRQYLREVCAPPIELVRADCLETGLDRLRNHRFDAVLLDLELPDSRGFETFEALREATVGIPVVVLTGINDQSLALRAVQTGAQDYLVKSELDGRLLVRSILYAVERQRLIDHIELQARQLERDRARHQFLELMAHELRNPMAVVKAILTLIRMKLAQAPGTNSLIDRVTTAEREMDRISYLLNEVLDAFRADKEQIDWHTDRVDLRDVVQAALRPFQASERSHHFECLMDPDPAWVLGDFRRLEQVVRDLLENAVKYSPNGGTVRVLVVIEGETAVLSVEDEGLGVPPDQRERIFDAFYRASNVTPYDLGGLGLGLFLCRSIVTQHGGRIWVDPTEGAGARFSVSLPLSHPEAEEMGAPEPLRGRSEAFAGRSVR